jgi:hypothetical protein
MITAIDGCPGRSGKLGPVVLIASMSGISKAPISGPASLRPVKSCCFDHPYSKTKISETQNNDHQPYDIFLI